MQHQTARAALRSASAQTAPLVITPTLPPVSGRDEQGVNRRLGLFLGALGSGGAPIRILRLVRDSLVREWEGRLDELSSRESQYWGLAVDIRLIARRSRAETFLSHYVRGITDAAQQPDFFPFGGPQAVQAIAAELDRCAGIVFVHRLPAMAAVLQTRRRPARLFFDLDDVEHRMRLRQALQRPIWPGKLLYAAHAPALLRAEQRGAAISRATFVCSDRDRAHLARLGVRRVASLPNAVRFPATVPPLADAPTILYLGVMSSAPNIAAAERLARRIMPLVWQAAPRARLLVAGDGSRELPSATGGDPRVEYLGYVPDLDAL
ncbi:MAG: glycosyltransferase, partial [Rhodospirillales bacterium]|nr:glycosyltransferase [Rhodospirillales bacterium]